MKFSPMCLLASVLLGSGLGVSFAGATESADDVSIRLKGDAVVYTQKNRVEVFELRGDRKDPNFFERSWASTQVKEQERQRERDMEKAPSEAPKKEVAKSSDKRSSKTSSPKPSLKVAEKFPEKAKKRATNRERPAKRNKLAALTTDQAKGSHLKD